MMNIALLRDVTAQVLFEYEGYPSDKVERTFKKGSVLTVEDGSANDKENAYLSFTEEQSPEAILRVTLPRDSFKVSTLRAFRSTFLFAIDSEEAEKPNPSLKQVKNFLNNAAIIDINVEEHGDPLGFTSAEVLISELEEVPAEQVKVIYPNTTSNFSHAGVSPKKKVVVGRLTPDERRAIALANLILNSFKESNLYEDYRDDEEEGFTDAEFDEAVGILNKMN